MHSSFFSFKWLAICLVVILAMGSFIGIFHINPDHTRCYDGTKQYTFDKWYVLMAFGKYEIRYAGLNWDCKPGFKINTDEFKTLL